MTDNQTLSLSEKHVLALLEERAALRAEVERLRAAHGIARADADDLHSRLVEKARENEGLKTEEQRTDERSTVALLEADNAWLRVELTHRVGWEERCLRAEARLAESEAENDQWQRKLTEVWDEVAALRKALSEHHPLMAEEAFCDICNKLPELLGQEPRHDPPVEEHPV